MLQLRNFDGPFTRELMLAAGQSGLGSVPATAQPAGLAKATCGFCSTGCGLTIHLDESGQAINVTGDADHPVNRGAACPKGWEALTPLAAPDRATVPLLDGQPIEWHAALETFCDRFKAIQRQHGAEAVAFLSTGQLMTEEMAFLGALAKFGMGMVHGDGNTRQCMATAVTAYKESFGFDAPPYTYQDLEESDVLVFVGANPAIAHPIMWQRVERNPHRPEIIVIDPRLTETAMAATQHLPIAPKSDLTLFYCLADWLIREGKINRDYIAAHTRGFEAFADFAKGFAPDAHLSHLGLTAAQFEKFARSVADGKRVSFWWTMGVNQGHEAVRTAQAIINVALMTGNIGRPGTGPNSITGQCNAMGSRLFSNTTNLIGGHDFANPTHRLKVAAALGLPVGRIPDQQGWAYDQILEGIETGAIRGLWIICTNPAHSWIEQRRFARLREQLDFLVVQDMYATTETARLAGLVLPAAGWGEKDGTFINSERRIGLSRKVSRAPGQALSDFNIFRLVARYWGCGDLFAKWDSPEAVFQMLKEVSRGQPCDISGIRDYAMIEECGGIQWPWLEAKAERRTQNAEGEPCVRQASGLSRRGGLQPANDGQAESPPDWTGQRPVLLKSDRLSQVPPQQRRLFEDGRFFTADGRARFIFDAPRPVPERPDDEYPFILLTGRGTSAQWHTQSRTAKSAILRKLYPADVYIEINSGDGRKLGLKDGGNVRVISRRAEITARARLTSTIQSGQVFLPMHYPEVNQLTLWSVDPHSRQPSYKHCAVRVEAVRT